MSRFVRILIGVLLAAFGLWLIVAAGGNEPEPIRAGGVYVLVLAAVIGLAATLVLRSGNPK